MLLRYDSKTVVTRQNSPAFLVYMLVYGTEHFDVVVRS